MSEIDNASKGMEQKGFFSKLISGDFGLAKTYWLFGVLANIMINVVVGVVSSLGALALILALAIAYQVVVLLGIWQAATRYEGRKVWAILAKIATVLGWLTILGSFGVLVEILGKL